MSAYLLWSTISKTGFNADLEGKKAIRGDIVALLIAAKKFLSTVWKFYQFAASQKQERITL